MNVLNYIFTHSLLTDNAIECADAMVDKTV